MEYIVIFIILSILSIIEINNKFDVSNRLFNVLIFILSLFIGMRNGLGADYYRYESLFNTINWERLWRGDNVGFRFIVLGMRKLHFTSELIFLVFAFILCLTLRSVILNMNNYRYPALLIFFSLYMIPLGFNAMAQGLATGIILYSYRYFEKKDIKSVILLSLLAVSFHSIGWLLPICYVVYRINDTKKHRKYFLALFLCAMGCLLLLVENGSILFFLPRSFKDIYLNYFARYQEGIDLTSVLARFVMAGFVIYGYKQYDLVQKKIFMIYLVGLGIYFVLHNNSLLATRINLSLKISEVILVSAVLRNMKKTSNRTIVMVALIIFLGVVLYGALQHDTVYPYDTWLFK